MSVVKYLDILGVEHLLRLISDKINYYVCDNDNTISGTNVYEKGPYGTTSALSGNVIDLNTGNVFTKTISANTTFSIMSVPTSKSATFSLILTNGGAYTITWPASVKWSEGTAPDLTANGVDVLTFLTPNGGTTWYGTVSLSNAS